MKKDTTINVGDKFPTKNSGEVVVISVVSSRQINVQFLDTGNLTSASATMLQKGSVRDYYAPSVCGVGYLGGPNLTVTHKKAYVMWLALIKKVYVTGVSGHTVCDEWLNFSQFLLWYNANTGTLDKPVIQVGTFDPNATEYGPTTAFLLPKRLHVLFYSSFTTPTVPRGKNGNYRPTVNYNGHVNPLGSFASKEMAIKRVEDMNYRNMVRAYNQHTFPPLLDAAIRKHLDHFDRPMTPPITRRA